MENKRHVIVFKPEDISAGAYEGELLYDVASRAGVQISHHCGGVGVCGKCRVKPANGGRFLEPLTKTEIKVLSEEDIADGVRLACCAIVAGGGDVHVVDKVETSGNKILQRVSEEAISAWSPDSGGYGVAVDIGTTTVVCYLLDLCGKKEMDSYSFLNPQVQFGDDVISRIAYSSRGRSELIKLQRLLIDEMDMALGILANKNGIEKEDINEVVIAANTVMEHIFIGISPESIGHSPYMPEFFAHPPVMASRLGLNINEDAIVKMLPNVAGYVGADIVAGVAAYRMDKELPVRLLVDIGTNNEIVLGNSGSMFCCATAAGPAFEGARIQYGMRASNGAIEEVTLAKSGILCGTIGGAAPKGICGSGLIDAVALLIKTGIVGKSGRIQAPEECRDAFFKDIISRDKKGMVRVLLTDDKNPVYLTQKDIREVQLAVGAVKVGIEVLLERMGISKEDVDEILLAGAFGNNIDVDSAIIVGLLPDVPPDRISSIHNSSGFGACLSLASSEFYESTKVTADKMSYIELSSLPDFQKRFVRAMIF